MPYSKGDVVSFVIEGSDGRVQRVTGTIRTVYKSSDGSRSYKIKEKGGREIQYTVQEQDVLSKEGILYKVGDHVKFQRSGTQVTGHIAKSYPLTKEYFVMEESPSFKIWRLTEAQITSKVDTKHSEEDVELEIEQDISLKEAIERGGGTILALGVEESESEEQELKPPNLGSKPFAGKAKTDPESYFRYGFFILIGLVLWSAK